VFAARPEIRVVSRYGAGFDTINTADARRMGIWVANSPDYGVGEVATHALALILALLRHLHRYDRDVRAGTWHYLSPGPIERTSTKTLGILGLGRIGKRLAHLAHNAFGHVIACDPYIQDADFPSTVARATLSELFSRSHVVSVHVPLNDETRGMVDAALLRSMPRGSVLVNTARGPIVNPGDLLQALEAGILDGAGLDVLPAEPPRPDDPLVMHPRVLCTPHAAFYSVDAERELRTKAALNLVQWARCGQPNYVVVTGAPGAGAVLPPST
jgi:D-3-phosphoglycerate dehydrogenase